MVAFRLFSCIGFCPWIWFPAWLYSVCKPFYFLKKGVQISRNLDIVLLNCKTVVDSILIKNQSSDICILFLDVPVVTASIPTAPTRLGNSVTITCTVSADPGATRIIWQIINPATNQGVNIDTSIGKYSGGTLAIPSLTINPVGESDEGNYQCLAENAIGTTPSNRVYLDTIGGNIYMFDS